MPDQHITCFGTVRLPSKFIRRRVTVSFSTKKMEIAHKKKKKRKKKQKQDKLIEKVYLYSVIRRNAYG